MPVKISPSQVKDYLRCPRAWFLKSVLYAPDDAGAGGLFLMRGTAFDVCVQLWSAGRPLSHQLVVAGIRSERARDSGMSAFTTEQLYEAAELGMRQLRAAAAFLPEPTTAAVQHAYEVGVGGDVLLTGKTDLRRSGMVWDTKTTSDRGPGRGAANDRDAYALTDADTPGGNLRPLADDIQARCYALCEFLTNPDLVWCLVRWVYVTKSDSPSAWAVSHTFARGELFAWAAAFLWPLLREMAALKTGAGKLPFEWSEEKGALANAVAADQDGCARCFTKLACHNFDGVQLDSAAKAFRLPLVSSNQPTKDPAIMPFVFKRPGAPGQSLEGPPPAVAEPPVVFTHQNAVAAPMAARAVRTVEGVDQVRARLALAADPTQARAPVSPHFAPAVAVNRPAVQRPAPAAPAVETTGEPAADADAPAAFDGPVSVVPKARRGRPRKSPALAGAGGVADHSPTPAPTGGAANPSASGSARDLAVAAEDLASAVQSMRDLCDRVIHDLDARIAGLLAQVKAGGG